VRLLLPVALVASLLVGCDQGGASRLVISGDGELNEGVSAGIRMKPGERFLMGMMPVCPTGPGVEVTSVETTGDVEVTGFDLRENPFVHGAEMVGSVRATLEEYGLDRPTVEPLTEPCGDEDQFYELIVEMRAGDTDTGASGYRVNYSSGSENGTLVVEYGVYACVDFSIERCVDLRPS